MLVALAVLSFLVGTLIGATGVGGVLLIPAIMFFGGLGTHDNKMFKLNKQFNNCKDLAEVKVNKVLKKKILNLMY